MGADDDAALPPFRADAAFSELFDTSTYLGRLDYTWALCSPLGLQHGRAAFEAARSTLRRFDDEATAGGGAGGAAAAPPPPQRDARNAELWHAKCVLSHSRSSTRRGRARWLLEEGACRA